MVNNEFVDLVGYAAPYRLFKTGRLIKMAHTNAIGRRLKAIEIKPQYHYQYPMTRLLRPNGNREPWRLAHLVIENFLAEHARGRYFVRFKDGSPKNCSVDNLLILPYAVMANCAMEKTKKPVFLWKESAPDTILWFPSIEAASRDVGLSHDSILSAINEPEANIGVGAGKRSGDSWRGEFA